MPSDLVFMMGKYEARLPGDLLYSDNHLWFRPAERGYRVGFTSYSVKLLQDVYFLDWSLEPGTAVRRRQQIGEIESSKALSQLFAPYDGFLLDFNERLLDDPSAINTDNYHDGWLFGFECDTPLLTPQQYYDLLESSWEETQRMIKGQINQG
jgi:glycine cleavage system H protein